MFRVITIILFVAVWAVTIYVYTHPDTLPDVERHMWKGDPTLPSLPSLPATLGSDTLTIKNFYHGKEKGKHSNCR